MYYTDVSGLNPLQNSYSIDLLNKSTEIAKIMFLYIRKRRLFQTSTLFQVSPSVVSLLFLKDTM